MTTREHTKGAHVAMATGADACTDDVVWRLTMLLQRCGHQPPLLELGLDICRLEFARWLAQRGILNEGVECANRFSDCREL